MGIQLFFLVYGGCHLKKILIFFSLDFNLKSKLQLCGLINFLGV